MKSSFRPVLLLTTLLLVAAQSAHAGGLYIREFGTPSMGTASAGAAARASDASTAGHNPAGMTRLDDHQLMAALAPGYGDVHFDKSPATPRGGGNGGNQAGLVPILSSYYVHKLSDRFRLGFALVSISGAALDPNNNWAGRYQLTNLALFTLSAAPTVAFRVSDHVSIGAGPIVTYGSLDWKVRPAGPLGNEVRVKLDGADDVATAAMVGLLLEPSPDIRVGIVYQSKTDLKLDGKLKAPAGIQANSKVGLPLAQFVRFDVYWKLTDRLALLYGGDWEDWSEADSVPLTVGAVSGKVKLGMKDTWNARVGLEYRLESDWLLQTGFSYDSSPLDTKDRIPALPLDRQIRVAVGAVHDWSENTQLGLSFEWVNLGQGKIDNSAVKGDYSKANEIFFLGLNLNWKKLPWSGRATL